MWFVQHIAAVNRGLTPWLVVMFHAPFYHTYYSHYKEMECFRAVYEPLFLSYGVDLVISGHVHSYERTHPMYQYQVRALPSVCGPAQAGPVGCADAGRGRRTSAGPSTSYWATRATRRGRRATPWTSGSTRRARRAT